MDYHNFSNRRIRQEDEKELSELAAITNPSYIHYNTVKANSSYESNTVKANSSNESNNDYKTFNTKAFCIIFSWGWVLVVSVASLILAFAELPITTFDVLSDLLNTFQVFLLVISLLITYQILSTSGVSRFLEKFRDTYKEERGKNTRNLPDSEVERDKKLNNIEAAGCIMGELAEVVIHKLPR